MTPTSRIVVDSWAWIELFSGSEKGRKVENELSQAGEAFTTSVSLAEVVSVVIRRGRPFEGARSVVGSNSKVLVPSGDDAVEAGVIHARIREGVPNFSLADAFVLQAARKLGAKVVTGDEDFRGIKEAKLIE